MTFDIGGNLIGQVGISRKGDDPVADSGDVQAFGHCRTGGFVGVFVIKDEGLFSLQKRTGIGRQNVEGIGSGKTEDIGFGMRASATAVFGQQGLIDKRFLCLRGHFSLSTSPLTNQRCINKTTRMGGSITSRAPARATFQ